MIPRFVREDVERDRYEIEQAEEQFYASKEVEELTRYYVERDQPDDGYDDSDPYDRLESEGGHIGN